MRSSSRLDLDLPLLPRLLLLFAASLYLLPSSYSRYLLMDFLGLGLAPSFIFHPSLSPSFSSLTLLSRSSALEVRARFVQTYLPSLACLLFISDLTYLVDERSFTMLYTCA